MELRHLRYFVAVAEEEHLGRAARRLHVSPPPLSKQIRQLEEELGAALFARVGRGLKLTEAGRVFLERARAVLSEVARSVAAVQATSRGDRGHLTVGFTETGPHAEIVPAATAELRRRHAGVAIELVPMNWPDEIPALLARRIDAALCNGVPDEPGLDSVRLLRERIVLALPRDHPLARNRTVSVRAIRDEPFIWLPRSALSDAFRRSIAEFAARGASVNVVVEARSTATRVGMVAAGMGLTFVLESTRTLLPPNVVLRPVSDLPLTVDSVLAWRREDVGSPVLRSWREIVQSVARARGPARPEEPARAR
jgi:DNA-binding transcriptional LysR family regulator